MVPIVKIYNVVGNYLNSWIEFGREEPSLLRNESLFVEDFLLCFSRRKYFNQNFNLIQVREFFFLSSAKNKSKSLQNFNAAFYSFHISITCFAALEYNKSQSNSETQTTRKVGSFVFLGFLSGAIIQTEEPTARWYVWSSPEHIPSAILWTFDSFT